MKCLNPHCDKNVHARGLCRLCYLSATRLVRLGRTTWPKLIKSGKATPLQPRGDQFRAEWLLRSDKSEKV